MDNRYTKYTKYPSIEMVKETINSDKKALAANEYALRFLLTNSSSSSSLLLLSRSLSIHFRKSTKLEIGRYTLTYTIYIQSTSFLERIWFSFALQRLYDFQFVSHWKTMHYTLYIRYKTCVMSISTTYPLLWIMLRRQRRKKNSATL